jgi:hypothetical protein
MSQIQNSAQPMSSASNLASANILGSSTPAVPVLLGLDDFSTGSLENFGLGGVSHDASPVVVFTAAAGDTISLYDNGTLIGTMVAKDGVNAWKVPATLSNGAHELSLTDTNAAGVTSAALNVPFTVETALGVPQITTVYDVTGPNSGYIAPTQIATDSEPTVMGTGGPGNTISIYDHSTLVGSTVVNADGRWSYKLTSPLPDGAHSLNVSASNGSESVTATDPYVFSTTQIMVTGVYSDGTLVTQGGAANGTVTITGWIADPSLASKGMKLYVSGGNVGTGTVLSSDVTVTGNTFTAVVSQESTVNSLYSIAMADGTYHIDARAVGDSTNILTVSDSRLGWTFSDTWANSAVQTVSAVQGDHSAAAGDASALSSSQQAVSHASVGAHDAFTGVTGGAIVDLNADPASCFKDASAHIQGATGGVNTLHLVGDHQVLDMTSLERPDVGGEGFGNPDGRPGRPFEHLESLPGGRAKPGRTQPVPERRQQADDGVRFEWRYGEPVEYASCGRDRRRLAAARDCASRRDRVQRVRECQRSRGTAGPARRAGRIASLSLRTGNAARRR